MIFIERLMRGWKHYTVTLTVYSTGRLGIYCSTHVQICVGVQCSKMELIWQWSLGVNSKQQETPPYRIVCCFLLYE